MEQFDTIVYRIVDTVYAVLAGINLVISKTACLLEKNPSLMLLVKSCMVRNFSKF